MSYKIRFNRFCRVGNEDRYLSEALAGGWVSGDGPFTARCNKLLEQELGIGKALLTTSCTHALEMCALLLDLQPGDEVILPSFTFVSTANAFTLRGAVPRFADIRRDTLNIDEARIEPLVSKKTKAIIVVHYAGVGCEMDEIAGLARRHNLTIIEDNAHGLFGTYKGRALGSFGSLAAQSFHETKNFSCGEGGALLINDPELVDQAEIIREKGTDRSRFFRGQVDKYSWVGTGSSYLPSDILAAILCAQLEARHEIQQKRHRVWTYYHNALQPWAVSRGATLPVVPDYCGQSYHMYYVLMPTIEHRQALIEHLKSRGILSVFHYLPLHVSSMGRRFGGQVGDCPVAEDASDRLLRLPFYNDLTESQQAEIVDAMHEFRS